MTLPATIDTVEAMVAYIAAHASWPSGYQVHGQELPTGWSLTTAVVVFGDGGPLDPNLPMLPERFTFWCYGATTYAARQVADKLHDVLHRGGRASATITEGTAVLASAWRVMGPEFLREPETEWPRWVVAYNAIWSECCVT